MYPVYSVRHVPGCTTFVRAIETSDFERRLKIVEDEHAAQPAHVPGMFGTGPGGQFNL